MSVSLRNSDSCSHTDPYQLHSLDESILDLHYQSLQIPPPSKFNRSTLDSLYKTVQYLDGHLDRKITQVKQDIQQIQETSSSTLNDVLTYAAFALALCNSVCFYVICCHSARTRRSSATHSRTKTLVATRQELVSPQCDNCHRPRRQTSAHL